MAGTNPVVTYTQPNNNTQTGAAYKANLDGAAAVFQRDGDNFACHAQATPNMTIALDAGHFDLGGTAPVEVAAQNSSTLSAPVSNPRIDLVVVNAITGALSVVAGTEAASPVAPARTPGTIQIAKLAMFVGMTSITDAIITDAHDFTLFSGRGFGLEATLAVNTTTDLGTIGSHVIDLTGTSATITSWGNSASTGAPIYCTRFASTGAVISGSLLPTGSAYTAQAGDAFWWKFEGSSTWRLVGYVLASGGSLVGGASTKSAFSNLNLYNTGAFANQVFVTADELVLEGGGAVFKATSVSVEANMTTGGAGGLDTGSMSASTIYAIWAIYNPSTATLNALISLSASAPTMPSGYTQKALVGFARSATTAAWVPFIQYGLDVTYTSLVAVRNGSTGTISATTFTGTSTSLSGYIPSSNLSNYTLVIQNAYSGNGPHFAGCAPNSGYVEPQSTSNPLPLFLNNNDTMIAAGTFVYEGSLNCYFAGAGSGSALYIKGFRLNL